MTVEDIANYLRISIADAQQVIRSVGFPSVWTPDAIETWLIEGPNTELRNHVVRSTGVAR